MDEIINEEYNKDKHSLWRLNCLVYTGAMVIAKGAKHLPRQGPPASEERRALEIKLLRKTVGSIHSDLEKRKTNSQTKKNGTESVQNLRVFLRKKKDLLRIRTTQARRKLTLKKRKAINAKYRKINTKYLWRLEG